MSRAARQYLAEATILIAFGDFRNARAVLHWALNEMPHSKHPGRRAVLKAIAACNVSLGSK